MKYFKIFTALLLLLFTFDAKSQWTSRHSVQEIIDTSDLIFEGKILTDSVFFQRSPGDMFTCHKVLVMKQFKGVFKSDTIRVVTFGGVMILDGVWQGDQPYTKVGDEAIFFATNSTKVYLGGNDPNTFDLFFGPGISYVPICDKKDVVKEVYEPIEKATGTPRIVLRKNSCEK